MIYDTLIVIDKLKPYGIPISGCIDGFSRYTCIN